MSEKQLNECPNFDPFDKPLNLDNAQPFCPDPCQVPTKNTTHSMPTSMDQMYNLGVPASCDPMMSGSFRNDMAKDPDRKYIHRYPKGLRGVCEAMEKMFSDLAVYDMAGTAHPVPIHWGTQERAVMFAIGENIRPDNSLVVDRLRLPLLSLIYTDISANMDRYTYHHNQNFFTSKTGKPLFTDSELKPNDTVFGFARGIPLDIGFQLTAWTYFLEDMCQIIEAVSLKSIPLAYIRTQGNQWISAVKLDGMSNNIDLEPGNSTERIIKFQFNFTVEHYIPQPIARYKPVHKVRIDTVNAVREEEITEVLSRLIINAKQEEDCST